jgi:hypothetical protein
MVKQYPHTVTIKTMTDATQDANGNMVPGVPTDLVMTGRYEPANGNGTVEATDGTRINYTGIVYLPLPASSLKPGSPVEVKNGATVLCIGKILRFSLGQLNARIWL